MPVDDDAVAFLDDLAAAGYRDWEAPPTSADLPHRRVARGPHGAFVEVYLDPVLLAAFLGETPLQAWPVGVAAVCESYPDETALQPQLYNLMQKTPSGWRWAQLDGQRRVLSTDRPDDCIGCHGGAEDFVFSLFLPE